MDRILHRVKAADPAQVRLASCAASASIKSLQEARLFLETGHYSTCRDLNMCISLACSLL
jgi:hypothetical protein